MHVSMISINYIELELELGKKTVTVQREIKNEQKWKNKWQ